MKPISSLRNIPVTYYLDTNIFLYAGDPDSTYHRACKGILKEIAKGSFNGVTSVETIQEIVYFHQRQKQIKRGLRLVDDLFKIIPEFLDVDREVILEFRSLLNKYPRTPSRDIIHLASCRVYGLTEVVLVDKDFDKFKEITRIESKALITPT